MSLSAMPSNGLHGGISAIQWQEGDGKIEVADSREVIGQIERGVATYSGVRPKQET